MWRFSKILITFASGNIVLEFIGKCAIGKSLLIALFTKQARFQLSLRAVMPVTCSSLSCLLPGFAEPNDQSFAAMARILFGGFQSSIL